MSSGLLRSRIVVAILLLISCGACSVSKSQSAGSSVVVLVDFSKSFVPLSNDERALRVLSSAVAELAQREWQPPVVILWSRIQSASLISSPLCGPYQFQQSLIKRDNDDSSQIAQKLETCASTTVHASIITTEQTPYTDISGAVALAAEQGENVLGAKYVVIVSDFVEDLPPGSHAVKMHLNGERVLLLHRLGIDRTPLALVDHLARIRRWSEALRQAGAASVTALPLDSITQQRVVRALGAGNKTGTDVVVLQDLPDTARLDVLKTLATTLSKAARDWNAPVTVTWADMRDEPSSPWQMPPLEFTPRLIKASDESSTNEFPMLLNECAEGMKRFSPGAKNGDLGASLDYYWSAGSLDAQHVFLIASSFPDSPKAERNLPLDLSDVRIVMLPAPNQVDASDESAYLARVARWEKRLKQQHASVCRVPFNGVTMSSLLGCIYEH
jgi:hypothetical protein